MKTVSQFVRNNQQKQIDLAEDNLPEDTFHSHKTATPPPSTLTIQRKAIRVFPGGKAVALYYSPKLEKYISIPYDNQEDENLPITEETVKKKRKGYKKTVTPGPFDLFRQSQEGKQLTRIVHRDGTISKVDAATVNAIMGVHKRLNKDNKAKLEYMVSKNKEHFNRVAAFCSGAHEDEPDTYTSGERKPVKATGAKKTVREAIEFFQQQMPSKED